MSYWLGISWLQSLLVASCIGWVLYGSWNRKVVQF